MKNLFGVLFTLVITLTHAQPRQYFSEIPIFLNGTEGYACYRIPAIVKAPNGDLLAFAEGRVNGCNDFGNLDIVMKRSSDNGMNWSGQIVVAENGNLQAGNPAPVVDFLDPKYPNGRVFLFYNTGIASEHETRQGKGLREVWYITSSDHGGSWSKPTNITNQVHRPNYPPTYNFKEDWRSYATTPGHALQISSGEYKGRLFIPANHSASEPQDGFKEYRAHAFYSDDHGESWQLSENVDIPSSNESIAVQLSDGNVMQNIRYQSGESKNRIVALSSNGGASWDTAFIDTQLPGPVCQASIIDYQTPFGQNVLLFSNPNSQKSRENMTVRVSFDDGKTWLLRRVVREGESAYSDLVIQEDNKIGLLYEHGSDNSIYYAHFNWDWLINGKNHTDNSWVKKLTSNDLAKDFSFQLAAPMLEFESLIFSEKVEIKATLNYSGVRIHYTLDGSLPNEESQVFQNPLVIENTSTLKVRAFHDHCLPSELVETRFIQVGKLPKIVSAKLTHPPHDNYPGEGAQSLFDLKKGTTNFRESVWMGFTETACEVLVEFEEVLAFNELTVSCVTDTGAWIFPPKAIKIFSSDDGENFKQVYQKEYGMVEKDIPSSLNMLSQSFDNQESKFLKIVVENYGEIPDWHPGKGFKTWLFVDEILIQ